MANLSFDKDNKIMEVGIADTEITIQEMVDQIRDFEDDPSPAGGMDIPKVLDAYGKQPLGGADSVGMTITIIDWTIKFADRPGPTWVVCSISGGNLTAYDTGTSSYIVPITAAAYVNTNITASSSATSTSQALLEHGAFNERVTVDTDSSYTYADSTDTIIVGTPKYPVNNITDAKTIATERGFTTLGIIRDMTIDSGTNLDYFRLIGRSHIDTQIIMDTSASLVGLIIEKCDVSGVLDGGTQLDDCLVGDLVYFNGHIHNCGMYGTIYLDGNQDATIGDCITFDQDVPPTIDMGGTGQSVAIPNYSGLITISNFTDATKNVGVGLNAGMVILDSTIDGGNFIIAGNGMVMDNSTSTTSINTDGLTNRELITKATWDEIVYDSASTETGTAFPVGTLNHPVNNLTDLKTIGLANNISNVVLHSDITLDSTVADLSFIGQKKYEIDLGGQNTANTRFSFCLITGVQASPAKFDRCRMANITNLCGSMKECVFPDATAITLCSTNAAIMIDCATAMEGPTPLILDFTNGSIDLQMKRYSGGIKIINSTDATNIAGLSVLGGQVVLDATCTFGAAYIGGTSGLTDNSGASFTVDTTSLAGTAEDVWDVVLADHVDSGSTGEALDNVSGGSSPTAIAAAVWDETTSTHTTAGTFGKLVQFIKLLILSK